MIGVHSVGFDLALIGTFLNPLRAAFGAEGPTLGTHYKDHPLRATDRARGQRHHFSSSPSYLARLQVHPSGKPVPRGEERTWSREVLPTHSVQEVSAGRYRRGPHLRPRSKGPSHPGDGGHAVDEFRSASANVASPIWSRQGPGRYRTTLISVLTALLPILGGVAAHSCPEREVRQSIPGRIGLAWRRPSSRSSTSRSVTGRLWRSRTCPLRSRRARSSESSVRMAPARQRPSNVLRGCASPMAVGSGCWISTPSAGRTSFAAASDASSRSPPYRTGSRCGRRSTCSLPGRRSGPTGAPSWTSGASPAGSGRRSPASLGASASVSSWPWPW